MSFDKHQMQAVNMALHEVRISTHSVTMWHQHVSMVAARRLKRFIRPKHRVRNAVPRVKPGSAPHHFSRHLPKIHTRQAAITRIFSKTLQVAGCSGYIHTDFTVPPFRLAVASGCPREPRRLSHGLRCKRIKGWGWVRIPMCLTTLVANR